MTSPRDPMDLVASLFASGQDEAAVEALRLANWKTLADINAYRRQMSYAKREPWEDQSNCATCGLECRTHEAAIIHYTGDKKHKGVVREKITQPIVPGYYCATPRWDRCPACEGARSAGQSKRLHQQQGLNATTDRRK